MTKAEKSRNFFPLASVRDKNNTYGFLVFSLLTNLLQFFLSPSSPVFLPVTKKLVMAESDSPPAAAAATSSPADAPSGTSTLGGVKCNCGKDAVRKVCRKEGPNKDRPFWTCADTYCKFFQSADGNPWIRGRTVGGEFRPYKKFLVGNSAIKKSYSVIPKATSLPVESRGVKFMKRVLIEKEPGTRNPNAITALRVYPCLKIVKFHSVFLAMKKLPPKPDAVKSRSTGYKFQVARISRSSDTKQWVLTYDDPRDAECSNIVKDFISGLAVDPKKTIGEMGKKMGSCCICGHNLTDPESIGNGYGAVCARIFDNGFTAAGMFDAV